MATRPPRSTGLSVLEREVFNVTQAAKLLGVPPPTARSWLDGAKRKGVTYPPVVRASRTRVSIVTWGEYVELEFLAQFRTAQSLQSLRPIIEALRDYYQTPYPLATVMPYLEDGRDVVLNLQRDNDTPEDLRIVVEENRLTKTDVDQFEEVPTKELTAGPRRFVTRAQFDPAGRREVTQLHPRGKQSPIVMDPLVRSGRPAVRGVAVEVLGRLHDAGDDVDYLADAYLMDPDQVQAAIEFARNPSAA